MLTEVCFSRKDILLAQANGLESVELKMKLTKERAPLNSPKQTPQNLRPSNCNETMKSTAIPLLGI